jgi:hypothetical protein
MTSIPFASLFASAGAKYRVDPALLAAVAKAESGFNPNAVSPAGAIGLMQIMPSTAVSLGVDPRDPAQAIDGAARLFKQNLQKFGSVSLAAAAYNAGPGAVQQYGGIPPYPETQDYVRKVVQYQKEFEGSIGTGEGITSWVKQHPVVAVGAIILAVGGVTYYFRPDLFRKIPVVGRFAAAENPVRRAPHRRRRTASRAPGAGGGRVQTLLFPRDKFTPATATAWARSHGFKSGKTDVTDKYIRIRQLPPGGRMRTIQFQNTPIRAVVRFG